MSIDPAQNHFSQWWAGAIWFLIFIIFLAFLPFYQKSQRKPASVYGAFVLALALEMFGVPLSMYVITWIFGKAFPDGILWGHTLVQLIGLKGMALAIPMYLIGGGLIFLGWRRIYRQYWSKNQGDGQLVTTGIYRFIRHPQYTGFLMITFGMMCEWVTLPMLLMWPVLFRLVLPPCPKGRGANAPVIRFGIRSLLSNYRDVLASSFAETPLKNRAYPRGTVNHDIPRWKDAIL